MSEMLLIDDEDPDPSPKWYDYLPDDSLSENTDFLRASQTSWAEAHEAAQIGKLSERVNNLLATQSAIGDAEDTQLRSDDALLRRRRKDGVSIYFFVKDDKDESSQVAVTWTNHSQKVYSTYQSVDLSTGDIMNILDESFSGIGREQQSSQIGKHVLAKLLRVVR